MKGMKNVEVVGPGIPAPLKRGSGGARSGTVNVNTPTSAPKAKSTGQPNTASSKVVSPTKSK